MMNYRSTRGADTETVSAAQAILRGIAPDGGLYVPEGIPSLTQKDLKDLKDLIAMDYQGRAQWVLSRFLTDYSQEELGACVGAAYGGGRFEEDSPAPLARLGEEEYLLELWHGPTCAFKDLALQLLPGLLAVAAGKHGGGREAAILVATSGDTGKAALEGFKDVPGVRIQVFYPTDGVSRMQKRQMTTQQGENVSVVGVRGNFDDCQSGVKAIFADGALAQEIGQAGFAFSSANSINWGRLVPQIVYYVSAYCDLANQGEIALGEPVNFCVPTGNFGNILAAYYAKRMGLPVGRLLCASNRNNVLTDFIHTGRYDRNRPFYATSSPSMDILISSNLERLLYHLSGEDSALVSQLMRGLAEEGRYALPEAMHAALQAEFYGAFCDEAGTEETIRRTFAEYSYLCDPHTAVALSAARQYREETGDRTKLVVVSTASPYKFAPSVLAALEAPAYSDDDFQRLELLEKISGTPIPRPLAALKDAQARFDAVCAPGEMPAMVREFLRRD